MRRILPILAAVAVALLGVAAPSPAPAAGSAYTVSTLHFKTIVGPADDQVCDVVGDVYIPQDASVRNRKPAILMTNGFGGSKDDQAELSKMLAQRGYVALTYSGLGFGGSDCKITLDDPDWDGKAGSQLISYLGGASGIAFEDGAHTVPAPALDVVEQDGAGDPRVGMLGGSYGGQIQFAVAGVDKRLDTIVPFITWSDLTYSLAPNNTAQTTGVSTSTPGAAKLAWALGFSGLGMATGVQNAPTDPARLVPCVNFADWVCPALATAGGTGTLDAAAIGPMRHASVASYVKKVTIPTLLVQGQNDTLFNLNEGIANYRALKSQGTPVKMVWMNGGHSGPMAPGEYESGSPDPSEQALMKRVVDWLDHYLKDADTSTGPEFSYFRDWVDYTGPATPAYAEASGYPVGTTSTWYLSGKALTPDRAQIEASSRNFVTPPAGGPSSSDPIDVVGRELPLPLPEQDAPGTSVSYDSAALGRPVTVVGSPVAKLRVTAPAVAGAQSEDEGKLVLFLRIHDVAPDGTATLVRNLVAPLRVPDVSKPFTVTMPAFVHRFDKGHRIRLVVAGGSTNYRGGLIPTPVTIITAPSDTAAQSLTLPTLGALVAPARPKPDTAGSAATTPGTPKSGTRNGTIAAGVPSARTAAATAATASVLPDTGGPRMTLLLAGLLLLATGADVMRRHRLAAARP